MVDDEVDLRLPARDLHHAVQAEVLQVPLLPKVLVDLSLGDEIEIKVTITKLWLLAKKTPLSIFKIVLIKCCLCKIITKRQMF